MAYMQVAIDGPAGAGKSSVAREVARSLHYLYIDTGAMYRALTFLLLQNGADIDQAEKVGELAETVSITFGITDDRQRIYLNGEDVTEEIRLPKVSEKVSQVSAISRVRRAMVEKQKEMASGNHVVMDGRDIGTVVLPDAQVKVFLTASPEERARRRFKELEEKGHQVDFQKLVEEIRTRDYMDENRADSPLLAAGDAQVLDTTEMTFPQVVDKIIRMIKDTSHAI